MATGEDSSERQAGEIVPDVGRRRVPAARRYSADRSTRDEVVVVEGQPLNDGDETRDDGARGSGGCSL